MKTKLVYGVDSDDSPTLDVAMVANEEMSGPPWIGVIRLVDGKHRAVCSLLEQPEPIGVFGSFGQAHDALVLYASNVLRRRGHLDIPPPQHLQPESRDALSSDATMML